MSSDQLFLDFVTNSSKDPAGYAIDIITHTGLNVALVKKRLRRLAVMMLLSVIASLSLIVFIRYGPRLDQAQPFVVLIAVSLTILFVFSLVAFVVIIAQLVALQNLQINDAKLEAEEAMEEVYALNRVIALLRMKQPEVVEDAMREILGSTGSRQLII